MVTLKGVQRPSGPRLLNLFSTVHPPTPSFLIFVFGLSFGIFVFLCVKLLVSVSSALVSRHFLRFPVCFSLINIALNYSTDLHSTICQMCARVNNYKKFVTNSPAWRALQFLA